MRLCTTLDLATLALLVACSSKTAPGTATNESTTGGASSVSTGGSANGGTSFVGVSTTGGGSARGGTSSAGVSTSGGTTPDTCMPGETQACLGPGQCPGAQVCMPSGLSWGFCDCGSNIGGDGGASSTGTLAGGAGGSQGGSSQAATGGGSTSIASGLCGNVLIPVVSGNLVVASTSYTTAGNLHGFGYTWSNFSSSATSKPCIAPTCTGTTCTPRFSSPTALCAAGTVEADSTYLSLVGLGMNLNQSDAGGTPDSVPAPASITVTTVLDSATLGYARVQLMSGSSGSDAAVTTYCVEAGQWKSGTPIPITKFNTKCWLPTGNGTALTVGTGLTAIYILIPCDGVDARPFSMCLTGITFTP